MKIKYPYLLKASSVCVGLFLSFLLFYPNCFADVSLTARPHSGAQELSFSQGSSLYREVNSEVDVEILGTSAQYEIRQEPFSALRNAKGSEIPWSSFLVSGLSGTNRFGRLKVNPEALTNSVLYTSNQNGSPDSFTLIYTYVAPQGITPDLYRGQMRFTFIPVGSGQSSISTILNVILIVKADEAAMKPSLEVTTASGSSVIYLNSKSEEKKLCDVSVTLNGSHTKPFTIKQTLLKPLETVEGKSLEPKIIAIEVSGVKLGTVPAPGVLSDSPQVVYTSKPTGEADAGFSIRYRLEDSEVRRAGRYRSRLQYSIEEMGIELDRKTLELEVENEQVFDIILTPQEPGAGIEFRDIKPGEGTKKNEVVIEIKTNTGKKYQVNQNVIAALSDKEGNVIKPKYFTVKTEAMETKGVLKIPQSQEVSPGDVVLFVSDDAGSSDKFRAVYELASPMDVKAGDYSTKISYSLLEI